MKRNSVLLFAALALLILQSPRLTEARSGPHPAPPYQGKEFKRTVEFEQGGDFTLKTDKGSVVLLSWDQNRIEIQAKIEPPKEVSADYGRRAVEGAQIDVTGGGRSLTVRSNFDGVPYKEGFDKGSKTLPDIHYMIRAPRNLNLSLDVDRSMVHAQGFKGRIKLETDRTTVIAGDLSGEIQIKMDRGEARLSNLSGTLNIETDRTSSKLRAVHIEGDSQVEIDRGDLELGISGSQALTVSAAKNRRADFENDFGLALNSSGGNSIEGTINGGGPRLSIRADRGRVSLKRE